MITLHFFFPVIVKLSMCSLKLILIAIPCQPRVEFSSIVSRQMVIDRDVKSLSTKNLCCAQKLNTCAVVSCASLCSILGSIGRITCCFTNELVRACLFRFGIHHQLEQSSNEGVKRVVLALTSSFFQRKDLGRIYSGMN